jgi:hypothetical protein
MKTGNCVRVKNQKSKHYNLKGIAINSGPQLTTVQMFTTNEVVTFPNEALEQSTHVSRPNIESEALKNAQTKIERIKREVQAMAKATEMHLEHAQKYQTDWSKATAKALDKELQDKREIIEMLNDLLEGK